MNADISGCWGRPAECLDRSLGTYTASPSNPSFTGALHQNLRSGRMSIFGSGFGLRCFQPLSAGAWLPGMPCQTTGKLLAPAPRSSRTKGPFPSDILHSQ